MELTLPRRGMLQKPGIDAVLDPNNALCADMVLCALFAENSGGQFKDYALGQKGVLQTGVLTASSWKAGRTGPAFNFGTGATEVRFTNDSRYPSDDVAPLTVIAMIFPTLFTNAQVILNIGETSDNNSQIQFGTQAATGAIAWATAGNGSLSLFSGGLLVPLATPSVIGCTQTSAAKRTFGVYNFGKLQLSDNATAGVSGAILPGNPWVIGRSYVNGALDANVADFNGLIELVMVWKRPIAKDLFGSILMNPYQVFVQPNTRRWFVPPPVATGITFDAASNSAFQTASSDYTFNRTVGTGTNRFLRVEVPILGTPGTTVTAVTDDNAGTPTAMTRIGVGSSATGAGIVEFWGLVNPVSGTKQIRIQLSGAVTSAGLAASYANVQQTSPYANFNSAQATNGVSAADATVTITTAATGSWAVAAIATTDSTGITAGQTGRNNINAAGAAGAGANEDTNAPVAPGTTAMTYPSVDALATWVIGGYELRPATAASLTTAAIRRTLVGLGTRIASRQTHGW